ncbi:MAG TPA: hypothetical protein VMG12_01855, partial [Polyangiaceae bacterium]|nr:hypothetical protein [Polyangiaceae bacterium]
ELIVAHTGVIPLSARTRSLTGAFRHFEIVTTDAEFEARLGAAVGELDIRDVTTLVDIEDGPFRDTWHVDANATLVAPAATGRAGERLSDSRGSVFLGWLDDGILYSRFERTITARLAARFAHRFSELVEERFGARYFSDSSAVVYYEPRAFAFISDAMRDNAAHFVRVTVRPRADIVATGKVSFPDALPGLEHIASEVEFSARLREATQPDGLLTLGSQQPASEREGEVLTPRTLARTAASAAATQVQETTARAADVHPALTRPLPSAGTLTYAFDLTHFEEGRLTAVRHPLPPSQSRDKWMCVARSDQHALAQAMVAAFVEWAVPRTRPPEQFTVRFSDAPSDPKPEQQS